MKIIFKTNIDAYKREWFPDNFKFVPREGEFVRVKDTMVNHLRSIKLPTRLKVVGIEYAECFVSVELWYDKVDKELAELAGAKTL